MVETRRPGDTGCLYLPWIFKRAVGLPRETKKVLQLHHKCKQQYTTAIKKVWSESSQAFPRAVLLVTVEASKKYAK